MSFCPSLVGLLIFDSLSLPHPFRFGGFFPYYCSFDCCFCLWLSFSLSVESCDNCSQFASLINSFGIFELFFGPVAFVGLAVSFGFAFLIGSELPVGNWSNCSLRVVCLLEDVVAGVSSGIATSRLLYVVGSRFLLLIVTVCAVSFVVVHFVFWYKLSSFVPLACSRTRISQSCSPGKSDISS